MATPVNDTSVTIALELVGTALRTEAQLLGPHPEPDVPDALGHVFDAPPSSSWPWPVTSTMPFAAGSPSTLARSRLDWPRKLATNVDAGCS